MGKHGKKLDPHEHTYEIGYKKPPKAGQFKPGHKGFKRRRNTPANFYEMLAKALRRNATVTIKGERKTMAAIELIANQLVTQTVNNPAKYLKANLPLIEAALSSPEMASNRSEADADFTAEFRKKIEDMSTNLKLANDPVLDPDKAKS